MAEYKDVFGEIGCLQGEYHIITYILKLSPLYIHLEKFPSR
jgi:hypothetical protein